MSNEGETLYAGKFKTVEDLEVGYKNAAAVYDENNNLKKKVEELSAVPDDYLNPVGIDLEDERISDIKKRAKDAGMNQSQYERFIAGERARIEGKKQGFEQAKKDMGEETLNILNDYISKHYPKELGQEVLKTLVVNKEARQAALNHRNQLLNNQVPGMRNTPPPVNYSVTDEDVRKAYEQKEKTKSTRDIGRYMNLVSQQAVQRRGASS